MMFVTDLTSFAENGFYTIIKAVYGCMCGTFFDLLIADGVLFWVRCDECRVKGIVSTDTTNYITDDGRLQLKPSFVIEAEDDET